MTGEPRPTVVGLIGLVALIGLLVVSAPFIRIVDNAVYDGMISTLSPWTQPRDDIVLVTVTERTLEKFAYRSPVDRAFLADTISAILKAEPKVLGLDILIDQPTEAAKDDRLRSVVAGAGPRIVLARADAVNGLTDAQRSYLEAFAEGQSHGAVDLAKSPVDGTVRRFNAGVRRDGKWVAGFAMAMAMAAGIEPPNPRSKPVPMIYYRTGEGAPYSFKQYPAEAAAVLPVAWFKDKFVLIGVDLPAADRHRTPFHLLNGPSIGNLPGVAIHAHTLAQLLSGERLRVVGFWWQFAVTVALSSFAIAIAFLSLHPGLRFVLVALICLGLWVAVSVLFSRTGILMPTAAPTLAVLASGGIAFAYVWYRDRQQRAFIKDAFSHYVSPVYVDQLIENPDKLNLGGQRREVSYIFTDVAGFTSLSEQMEPARLSALLNDYLDGVCGLFHAHGATIDKIIGDAVVGFIGAPVQTDDHAARAIALILALDEFCERFRAEREAEEQTFGHTRIGAHTGVAVIGNFGGSQFFDYTGLGDTVNTAARLESANRHFGTRLCVSGTTAKASRWPHFRPVGAVMLKGKTEAIEVFEPVSEQFSQMPEFADYLRAFELRKANDAKALEAFSKLSVKSPYDKLVSFQLEQAMLGGDGVLLTLGEK